MKRIVFLIISVFFCIHAFAQTTISGEVLNEKKQPVFNASVMLLRVTDSLPMAYAFTDEKGHYQLVTQSEEAKLLIAVYGFNLKRQFKEVENKTQTVDFTVVEEALQLKEVSVKSEKIWGGNDTVNYVVDAFRDTTDIVIADVLKKMPGIEVKDDGKVEYKGKPISKFYIENMDMLQGRYNLATTSIAASDVASVQVMENHQEVRALQNIQFSDNVGEGAAKHPVLGQCGPQHQVEGKRQRHLRLDGRPWRGLGRQSAIRRQPYRDVFCKTQSVSRHLEGQ